MDTLFWNFEVLQIISWDFFEVIHFQLWVCLSQLLFFCFHLEEKRYHLNFFEQLVLLSELSWNLFDVFFLLTHNFYHLTVKVIDSSSLISHFVSQFISLLCLSPFLLYQDQRVNFSTHQFTYFSLKLLSEGSLLQVRDFILKQVVSSNYLFLFFSCYFLLEESHATFQGLYIAYSFVISLFSIY